MCGEIIAGKRWPEWIITIGTFVGTLKNNPIISPRLLPVFALFLITAAGGGQLSCQSGNAVPKQPRSDFSEITNPSRLMKRQKFFEWKSSRERP